VIPNSRRKLPTIPSAKVTGKKTAAMETVAAVAAKAICRAPREAASTGASPCSRWRSMFSSTTMASSITTPTARVRPSSVITLRVKPRSHITPKVATSESGMAAATIRVGRMRRRKTNTVTTASTAPSARAKSVSSTASRMAWVKSMAASRSPKSRPAGIASRRPSRRA